MTRVVLLGSDVNANFTSTTSSYGTAGGEWGYAFTATTSGLVDTLYLRISTSATASNWRLLIRSTAGAILANGTVAAGENVTRFVAVTPFSVVSGTTYRMHFITNSGSPRPFQNAVTGTVGQDTSSTYASPEAIWVADSTPGAIRQFQMWAEGEEALAYDITSVNDDDEINPGEVNTAVVVGYDDGVNPIVSGTVGSLALTGVSQTDDDVTFTPPSPTNASYWPEPDTTQTLTLTDGTNPATFDALFNSVAGYTSVVIASPDNDDEYKLGYWATFPFENGDRVMFDPPNPPLPGTPTTGWTVNPDGSYTDAPDGLKIWYHWRSATSLMYIYEATVGGGVVTDNRLLTSVGLTSSGLTSSGLTSVGL